MRGHRRLFVSILALGALGRVWGTSPAPLAVDGVLDLRSWDFSTGEIVGLNGTWLYFPDEILSPELLAARGDGPTPVTVRVPGQWHEQRFHGRPGPVMGKGTCVLTVLLPQPCPELMLRTESIQASSRIFINEVGFGGPIVLDPRAEGEVAPNHPRYYPISAGTKELRILLQMSNYWDAFGLGINVQQRLGLSESVEACRNTNTAVESIIVGFLGLAVLYHLMLFFIQRRDRALLFFALTAVAVACRQMTDVEKFWLTKTLWPNIVLMRIEYGSVYALCLSMAQYFSYLYPKRSLRPLCRGIVIAGAAMLFATIVLPASVFTAFLPFMYAYIALSAGFGVSVIVRAVAHRDAESRIMLAGTLAFVLPTAVDVLNMQMHLFDQFFTPIGLSIFIFAQSYILARRYTRDAQEAEKLRVTAARLRELDQVKTNFLANVSHELRTPITLISAPLAAIRSGEYGESLPKDHRVFGLIQTNADRLLRLVENLLSITRLEARQSLELEALDLSAMVPVYAAEFESLARERGIELSCVCEAGVAAKADRKALETMVFNLVSNALKFTQTGGRVTIRVGAGAGGESGEAERAFVEVADTGIGIAAEDLSNLFSRYKQVYDKERHHYDGSGIGLSISRELARAMGGDIVVTSEYGKGSVFTLALPRASAEAAEAAVAEREPERSRPLIEKSAGKVGERGTAIGAAVTRAASGNRKTVLVVEDQAELRGFIAEGLAAECAVTQASDGQAAKEELDRLGAEGGNPPELIVSDIMMPRLDGIGLFEHARSSERLAAVPFIFLTAREEPEERLELLRKGAIDYIVKPFSLDELRAKIGSVLGLKEHERRDLAARIQTALEGPAPVLPAMSAQPAESPRSEYPSELHEP